MLQQVKTLKKDKTEFLIDTPNLSIIVPCYKEALNIYNLTTQIKHFVTPAVNKWELIIIDDNSQDAIIHICDKLKKTGFPVKLIIRKGKRGLASAVLEGFKHARADVLMVMDADLSHQPCTIPVFYNTVINGADFVIGSRYINGGKTDDKWTFYRYINSKFASLLAKPLVSVTDPMSGFFALHRSLLERCENIVTIGYKIALELIVKSKPENLKEIPIYFRSRTKGKSKLTIKQQFLYLYHLLTLYKARYIK